MRSSVLSWESIFARAASLRLLVVGDVILDEYLLGSVQRVSPEAPVPIVHEQQRRYILGGAANVASNLAGLGCHVSLVGVVGEDEQGTRLRSLLWERKVNHEGVVDDPARPTTTKTRVLADHQQVLRLDREFSAPLDDRVTASIIERLDGLTPKCDAIICSDYGKGVLTTKLVSNLIKQARRVHCPVFVDPKGTDYSRYRGATVITPNKREASEASGLPVTDEVEIAACARRLLEQVQSQAVLITRGQEGMTLYSGETIAHIPTAAQEVFDVTGAGDTVVSVLALAHAAGAPLNEAAYLANLAAGIVISKLGTAVVRIDELRARLETQQSIADRKIVDVAEMEQILVHNRVQGKRIVFTNGCFDILHAGHIAYLEAARRLGDVLVVGVNDDASVRRLKGKQRPLLSVEERTQVLAGLECIDYLMVFGEDTPHRLIETLRPDVLAKGDDYRLDEVVGREVVEKYGGRVELLPVTPGVSTTRIVHSILERYANGDASEPPNESPAGGNRQGGEQSRGGER